MVFLYLESLRVQHELPLNNRKQSEYEKFLLSFMSPLPNKQDFASNVCILMSNEGWHILKLKTYLRLLKSKSVVAFITNYWGLVCPIFKFYSKLFGSNSIHQIAYKTLSSFLHINLNKTQTCTKILFNIPLFVISFIIEAH